MTAPPTAGSVTDPSLSSTNISWATIFWHSMATDTTSGNTLRDYTNPKIILSKSQKICTGSSRKKPCSRRVSSGYKQLLIKANNKKRGWPALCSLTTPGSQRATASPTHDKLKAPASLWLRGKEQVSRMRKKWFESTRLPASNLTRRQPCWSAHSRYLY